MTLVGMDTLMTTDTGIHMNNMDIVIMIVAMHIMMHMDIVMRRIMDIVMHINIKLT